MINIALLQKRKYHKGRKDTLSQLQSTQVALGLKADILTPVIGPKGKKYDLMINWGLSGSKLPVWAPSYFQKNPETLIANDFDAVRIASNKLLTFRQLKLFNDSIGTDTSRHIPIPDFFTTIDEAREYLENGKEGEGRMVFCRTKLQSMSGNGIVVAENPDQLVPAQLYTARFPKRFEFRVHVAFGKAIRVQQKKKLNIDELEARGIPMNNGLIRNTANGYTFSTQLNYEGLKGAKPDLTGIPFVNASIAAVEALGLTFGAVDVGVHKSGKFCIFEINTSPGIEEQSARDYINAFREEMGMEKMGDDEELPETLSTT